MNNKRVAVLFILTIVILAGTPTSFAKPEYLGNLTKVYGEGSCGTCHVNTTSDGPRTSYGTLFENQPDHAANASAALIAIGAPPTETPTLTPIPTLISEETVVPTSTAVTTAETPKAPGFGIFLSLVGLFTLALMIKRNN
jgi:hypothetical protein